MAAPALVPPVVAPAPTPSGEVWAVPVPAAAVLQLALAQKEAFLRFWLAANLGLSAGCGPPAP
jgi:hypothetical protein